MPLQVIEDIPCYTSVELLEKHNCDICAHGGAATYCRLAHTTIAWNIIIQMTLQPMLMVLIHMPQ